MEVMDRILRGLVLVLEEAELAEEEELVVPIRNVLMVVVRDLPAEEELEC